eukprot:TRINITY_DN1910_c0_g1_i2.p1 TRINITY_DN1910_c0_g1~~TRINITY_DN1910_c0_g1_i2.p1  ORF type:complete len:182 (+),score=46.46 TRINITY_DN1910_c0_g1_i2:468-1013(+)
MGGYDEGLILPDDLDDLVIPDSVIENEFDKDQGHTGMSMFYDIEVSVYWEGEMILQHYISKRYSQFHSLHRLIRDEFFGYIPQVPPRTFLWKNLLNDTTFLENRKRGLQEFLNETLDNNRNLHIALADFLGISFPLDLQNGQHLPMENLPFEDTYVPKSSNRSIDEARKELNDIEDDIYEL